MIMLANVASNMIDAMHAVLNGALGSTASLEGRDGTPPASIGAGDSGSQIVQILLGNPVFLGVSGGSAGLNGSTDDTSTGTGTITYWRMKDSSLNTVLQFLEGSEIVTDNPTFASGDTCHLIDITLAYTVLPPDS